MKKLSIAAVSLAASLVLTAHAQESPTALRALAHEYYQWRDAAYPVATSGAGDHRFDERLTDYTMAAVLKRRQHVSDLLGQVERDEHRRLEQGRPHRRILFRAQLEGVDFFGRRLNPEQQDPQLYVDECSGAIFTLLQKEYAPQRTRALAAAARLEQMPALLRTARANLTQPVKLYAQLAIEAARGGDELYTTSLDDARGGAVGRRAQAPRSRRATARSRRCTTSRTGSRPVEAACRTGSRWARRITTTC